MTIPPPQPLLAVGRMTVVSYRVVVDAVACESTESRELVTRLILVDGDVLFAPYMTTVVTTDTVVVLLVVIQVVEAAIVERTVEVSVAAVVMLVDSIVQGKWSGNSASTSARDG